MSTVRTPVPSRSPSRSPAPVPARLPAPSIPDDLPTTRDLSFPRPEPKLVVPIVAPSPAHPFLGRPASSLLAGPSSLLHGATARDRVLPTFTREILPPAADPAQGAEEAYDRSSAPSAVRPRPRRRWADMGVPKARAFEILGFAIAWILTAGAAAVVIGHVLARSEMPAVVWLPPAVPASPSDATCSSSGQPPEVAVDSLPAATACAADAPRSAAATPPRTAPRRGPTYPAHRASPAGVSAPSSTDTLGDWMRAAVR